MKFTEFNLHENVLKGIENAGFKDAMPVQEKTIIEVLAGKDVGVQSQTGSGKTAAFLIPLLQYYSETEKENRKKTLIIAPTRELVVQIESEIELLGIAVDILPYVPPLSEDYPYWPIHANDSVMPCLLKDKKVIILPDISGFKRTDSDWIEMFVKEGGAVIAFGPQIPMARPDSYKRKDFFGNEISAGL